MRVKVVLGAAALLAALPAGCGGVMIQPVDWKETSSLEGFKFVRDFDDFRVYVSELWPRTFGVEVFVDVQNTSVRDIRVDPAGFELRTVTGPYPNALPAAPVTLASDQTTKVTAVFRCGGGLVRSHPSVLRFVVESRGRLREILVEYRPKPE